MRFDIGKFMTYLRDVKHTSKNTEVSYERDLRKMADYFESRGLTASKDITEKHLSEYIAYLEKEGKKPSTISRTIASMKAFYAYLAEEGILSEDIATALKAPKVEKKVPTILAIEDTEKLLNAPNGKSDKEIRDKAMLELLYATGIRVTELISLKLSDLNLISGYISCGTDGKKRLIPFGKVAKKALTAYINDVRERMVAGKDTDVLFTNCSGDVMSRQGFWKILKYYAKKAGINEDITPHTLRHSFAAHMVSNGADLHAVQEMMGHSDISSTQIYMQFGHGNVRDVYEKAHPRG